MKRVFAHIGFSFAVSMLVLNLIPAQYSLYLMAGLAFLLIASLFIKKYRQALAVPLCLGAATFACLIFALTVNLYVTPELSLSDKSAKCEFYITELPQITDDGQYSYIIKTTRIDAPNAPQNIKLRLKTSKPIECECYQVIKGKIRFSAIADNALASYGYWGKEIFLTSKLIYYDSTDIVIKSPMRFLISARQGIKNRLESIGGDEGALSLAMIIGDKSNISSKLNNDFRIAGAAHLMAVSGLHLTVICGFVIFILKRLEVKKKAAFWAILFVIVYYCALCGFSKSVVRAGIMIITMNIGKLIGKHSDPLNSLGLATFVICINPFAVCDIGAVLSILCVLSLCTAYPYFERKISCVKVFKTHLLNKLSKYVLNSVAAAFCILSYSICAYFIFFGYFSLASLISGIILIPLGEIVIILSVITDFFIRIKIGAPFIILTRLFNKTIILTVEKLASLNYSVINFENYFGFVAAGILIILALCFIINKKHLKKGIIISLILAIACVSHTAIISRHSSYILVTSNGATVLCNNENTIVFGVKTGSDYYSVKSFISTRKTDSCFIAAFDDNKYTDMLADELGCKRIIYKTYSKDFSDNLSVDYITKGKNYDFGIKTEGTTISISNLPDYKSDINVFKRTCFDKNGAIDLKNGDIIYRIDKGNYTARRFKIWHG
ncbi:MAG: ComEC/Rec2 family competence protein [Eubacterium sp.]|nr:ComEC/Rec2 family competence protein [Eubacterium sp.]